MKIRIRYEEKFTTIEIPDEDYSLMLDMDYEMRLAETCTDKKDQVKRCENVQQMFDHINKAEYNNRHKFDRHYGMPKKPFRKDDEAEDETDHMDYFPDNSDEEARDKQAEYDYICEIIHKNLKEKQAELLIAIVIDGVSVTDYAKREGVSVSAISHRMETVMNNFKKVFPKSSTFPSSQG